MSEEFVEENIYDKNGVLLLAKGQKTTAAMKKKLKKIGINKPTEYANLDHQKSAVASSITHMVEEKMSIRDERILTYSNKVLSSIIFESKTEPWWIYVNALSNYVDWLYTHSIDVAIISLTIAGELGYSYDELWNIGLGAFLHDIGKLLVPKRIIQKPGPLNSTEMVYMRQHCELGASSLESCCLPRECTDIILQHHERLDGSGYPQGLKGDEISRNAKIVMIADAVDAITSGRPYKESQKMPAAINILKTEEGKYSREFIFVLEKILGV